MAAIIYCIKQMNANLNLQFQKKKLRIQRNMLFPYYKNVYGVKKWKSRRQKLSAPFHVDKQNRCCILPIPKCCMICNYFTLLRLSSCGFSRVIRDAAHLCIFGKMQKKNTSIISDRVTHSPIEMIKRHLWANGRNVLANAQTKCVSFLSGGWMATSVLMMRHRRNGRGKTSKHLSYSMANETVLKGALLFFFPTSLPHPSFLLELFDSPAKRNKVNERHGNGRNENKLTHSRVNCLNLKKI